MTSKKTWAHRPPQLNSGRAYTGLANGNILNWKIMVGSFKNGYQLKKLNRMCFKDCWLQISLNHLKFSKRNDESLRHWLSMVSKSKPYQLRLRDFSEKNQGCKEKPVKNHEVAKIETFKGPSHYHLNQSNKLPMPSAVRVAEPQKAAAFTNIHFFDQHQVLNKQSFLKEAIIIEYHKQYNILYIYSSYYN